MARHFSVPSAFVVVAEDRYFPLFLQLMTMRPEKNPPSNNTQSVVCECSHGRDRPGGRGGPGRRDRSLLPHEGGGGGGGGGGGQTSGFRCLKDNALSPFRLCPPLRLQLRSISFLYCFFSFYCRVQ